jgi:hypothetical protein
MYSYMYLPNWSEVSRWQNIKKITKCFVLGWGRGWFVFAFCLKSWVGALPLWFGVMWGGGALKCCKVSELQLSFLLWTLHCRPGPLTLPLPSLLYLSLSLSLSFRHIMRLLASLLALIHNLLPIWLVPSLFACFLS